MKKVILTIFIFLISITLILVSIYYLEPITNKLASFFNKENTLVILDSNEYKKNTSYKYVQLSNDYIPYSFQDVLNIYYTVINNGWDKFTFYCPSEYESCLNDIEAISNDDLILSHLNNYVHPFNSFTHINTTLKESGEITLDVYYLYTNEEIDKINTKVDEIIKSNIKSDMSDYDKIKTIHDYIANNTRYDVKRNEDKISDYSSYKAIGPLFEGYATCNGYTDLMAIFLSKLGFDNYKVATTADEISYSSTGHVWNAVKIDDEWLHIDLTWDDPVASDGKDYLFHTYFLVTTEAMHEADKGKTVIEEHNFNSLYYLEFN